MEYTLHLSHQPDAVPTVRRYVRDRMRGTPLEARSDDAQLILTELVTNAALHGEPPVTVGVRFLEDRVRLEVGDGSRGSPMRPLAMRPLGASDAMTGRGLLLVESFSDRWGVDRHADGKVVWAEVRAEAPESAEPAEPGTWTGRDVALDEYLEDLGVDSLGDGNERFVIELGDVPTDLLVTAKAHVDNVVREFMLVAGGAASGQSAMVSRHLAELIDTVTNRFAEARLGIKRQAMASVVAGRPRTQLVLTLPVTAIKAGRDYLTALDEVDNYARAARMLTLETPPQHRAFRQWYVGSLIEQLEAAERGEEPPHTASFEQFLLDELEVVATAHRSADRSARLQEVTASLGGAASVEDVAAVVVSQGVAALGASGGALLVPQGGRFDVLADVDYGARLVAYLRAGSLESKMPSAVALRTGEPVWMESLESNDDLQHDLRAIEPDTVSMCSVPLVLAGRVLGVLRLSFNVPRLFDDDERAFVRAFVAQTVQALDRTELYMAERRARAEAETAAGRLSRLQHVTAALAGANDVQRIGQIVASEAHRTLGASVSALCLREGRDVLRAVEIQGAQPGTHARWQTFPVSANLPASEVVRTNQPVLVRSRGELERRYPELSGQSPRDQALVCVPLSVGGRALGALSLSFAPPFVVDDDVVDLLATIGRQCALAIERAQLMSAERAARRRSSFLADGTAAMSSSLDPEETIRALTGLVTPELADWSAVYLEDEHGRVAAATAQHRDAAVTTLMQRLQRDHPFEEDTISDFGDVLRTGRRVCEPDVSDEAADQYLRLFGGHEGTQVLRPRSVLAVPFVRRERILGALLLARVDGPSYSDDDLLLASELADRAAVAIDNAARFRREREVALTLQRSLLPQVLPRVPGLTMAWRYFPGAAGTHVGGDWYDVIPIDGGRVALLIGDVMGRGLQAAAVMGQLRASARAHISGAVGPAEVLTRIDTELKRLEQDHIATMLLGLLDPSTGILTTASAGHLPPLVRTDDSTARYVDVPPGPPLGAGTGSYTELEVTLAPGSTVLLYTDGLVEDRRLPIDDGMRTLLSAAEAIGEPEPLCDRVLVALGRDSGHDDDTAMLAVHLRDDL